MDTKRTNRIANEIKKILSELLINGMKDPRVSSVTCSFTNVKVTNDLAFAYIYVSVLGDDKAKQGTLKGLENAKGFLKKEIGRNLELRHVPELVFKLDETIEKAIYISDLINKTTKQDEEKRKASHE